MGDSPWSGFSNLMGQGANAIGSGLNSMGNWFSSFGTPDAPAGVAPVGTQGINLPVTGGAPTYTAPSWDSFAGIFGDKNTSGWAPTAVQGLSSLAQWQSGNKAAALAKDQFNFAKQMAQTNLANQAQLLNTAMEDRQNARRASSGSYQDTASYMNENKV